MLGGAAGAYIMRDIKRPIKLLRLFDFLTIILMASAVLFMKSGPFFYIFIFAAGVLGGGQFAAANLAMKQEGKGGMAGKLYAVDIAGSFLGSFATAIFMVPLAGVRNTIVFLICVKTVSLGLLIRYRNQDSI
ncbi:MAG: hypothetical protein HY757_09005 [Nitrospirae bacterium]|nr:hypothetical protein [Nitrospirota bacterium]